MTLRIRFKYVYLYNKLLYLAACAAFHFAFNAAVSRVGNFGSGWISWDSCSNMSVSGFLWISVDNIKLNGSKSKLMKCKFPFFCNLILTFTLLCGHWYSSFSFMICFWSLIPFSFLLPAQLFLSSRTFSELLRVAKRGSYVIILSYIPSKYKNINKIR